MNRSLLRAATAALVFFATPVVGTAQHQTNHIQLHVSSKWDECAIQLDPALTQAAWRQFTEEAALLIYLRPLTDARPMGAGAVEVSLLQWATAIDDTQPAWNDTFVHPSETHYLTEGSSLAFPGVMLRAGVSEHIDVGAYFTKNLKSNYGVVGGLIQHSIINDRKRGWAAGGRMSVVRLFGPEDVELTVLGLDLLASKTFPVNKWLAVSPYVTGSSYLSYAREKSPVVNLDSELVPGSQAMIGAVAEVSRVRLAAEVSSARVHTVSFKLGVAF
jgi:hypothetical protein